jgi:hypothetical protein
MRDNKRYTITTLQPAPSMNEDRKHRVARNYRDAVRQAQESWQETRRSTYLFTDNDTYWWHHIDRRGQETDRNFNY